MVIGKGLFLSGDKPRASGLGRRGFLGDFKGDLLGGNLRGVKDFSLYWVSLLLSRTY